MDAKEKAKELFSKYMPDLINELGVNDDTYELNRKFALIAVDEIIIELSDYYDKYDCTYTLSKIEYWQEVKQELEKL